MLTSEHHSVFEDVDGAPELKSLLGFGVELALPFFCVICFVFVNAKAVETLVFVLFLLAKVA